MVSGLFFRIFMSWPPVMILNVSRTAEWHSTFVYTEWWWCVIWIRGLLLTMRMVKVGLSWRDNTKQNEFLQKIKQTKRQNTITSCLRNLEFYHCYLFLRKLPTIVKGFTKVRNLDDLINIIQTFIPKYRRILFKTYKSDATLEFWTKA